VVRGGLRNIHDNWGVTLIELMIALVISAILVGGTYSIFITQQRTYVLQDQVVGVQQDARAALTIMARDIRMAGMLTGNEFSVNGASEPITPTNSNAGPDQIRVVYASEEVSEVSSVDIVNKQVTLTSGADRFDTSTRRYVAFEGIGHVYQVSSRTIETNTLTLTETPPSYLGDFSARVYCVNAITYDVSGNALRRNDGSGTQDLAGVSNQSAVEDLQLAYQVEDDTSNWYDDPADASADNSDIRVVRINLLVRTAVEDTDDQNYQRPALEDRAGSGTQDGFRRRVYTTVVKLRNR
jgi:prepilin-type N-terminal cleavage/methylation domain-containing protein